MSTRTHSRSPRRKETRGRPRKEVDDEAEAKRVSTPGRGRGRPRKEVDEDEVPKRVSTRGRGRPRKEESNKSAGVWFAWLDAYLSPNENKREAERVFAAWSVAWVVLFGGIVASRVYESFGDVEYMVLGLIVSVPYVILPWIIVLPSDQSVAWYQRYHVVANVWIAVFSYVGNYFWTHYFYQVLHASYSFPVNIQLNDVPLFLYLVTHAYFMMYHLLTTIILRRVYRSSMGRVVVVRVVVVVVLALVTAFMETYTIESVPYYQHEDKMHMYTVGSVVYSIYFIVSFPMFHRLAESRRWTARSALVDSLAASMIVTILLDLYRLSFHSSSSLPWLHVSSS